MIGISKLYCGVVEPSDPLRYGRKSGKLPSELLQFSEDKKPIVVWNCTHRCNLKCIHCYSQSGEQTVENELTRREGEALLEDLAEFGVPVVLFSGGEPLTREDLPQLIKRTGELGMRTVVSTNGTLIDEKTAEKLKESAVSYVGISLDGMRQTNDWFRGQEGAFEAALRGIRLCRMAGVKVGLRFTINKRNAAEIPDIFQLLSDEDIPRVCFYHLVYTGRAGKLMAEDLDHGQTRAVVNMIIDRTAKMHREGLAKEVLTVDNHTDGVYLYLRLLREKNEQRAQQVMELLKMNGGNNSGIGIGCVSWEGSVHADQFWRHYSFGNVRQRKFSQIWMDTSEPLMGRLKDRKKWLEGRCGKCRFLDICNGNLRVRAEAVSGNIWAPDPACYLTDEEIGL